MQNDRPNDEYGERVLSDGTTKIYGPKNDDAWIISDTAVSLGTRLASGTDRAIPGEEKIDPRWGCRDNTFGSRTEVRHVVIRMERTS